MDSHRLFQLISALKDYIYVSGPIEHITITIDWETFDRIRSVIPWEIRLASPNHPGGFMLDGVRFEYDRRTPLAAISDETLGLLASVG